MNTSKRKFFLVVIYLAMLLAGWQLSDWVTQLVSTEGRAQQGGTVNIIVISVAMIFVLASAIPFVPGAEIGFGLIMVFGGQIAPLVYACMVLALLLAFSIGRQVPFSRITAAFHYLGFHRAEKFMLKLAPLDSQARLAELAESAPKKVIPYLLRHRYLALILLFNLPGNSVLGGGGGIAFSAGLSKLFSYPGYLAIVMIGVAPVPMFFYLFN